MGLWVVRVIVWTTPNNVLHLNGYGGAVVQDFVIGSFLGLVFAIFTYKKKHIFQPKLLYWLTFGASGLLAVTPVVLLLGALIGVMFFGLTV